VSTNAAYEERLRAEHDAFGSQVNLHDDLPPAFHHWSERHVRPKLEALGVASLEDFFVGNLVRLAEQTDREIAVLSLGSGNGEQELGWLAAAAELGARNIRLRLMDINPAMQQRAADQAASIGVADRVDLLVQDFNVWRADREHDVVIANQSLHHVVALEHLYREIRDSLHPDGVLVVSDMIGRNGHRRWPEALEVVERLWATLPPSLRRNSVTGQIDYDFPDEDYSSVGFEGVRAQDVLPLLLDNFHPELFLAFANVVDPFVDRIYGGNFNLDQPDHVHFVEQLGVLDDALIDTGVLTPTHLIATFRTRPVPVRFHGRRSPERCVRDPKTYDPAGRVSFSPSAVDEHNVLRGAAIPVGRFNGIMDDQWVGQAVELPVYPTDSVCAVRVHMHIPEHFPAGSLKLLVDDVEAGSRPVQRGTSSCTFGVSLPARRPVVVRLLADWFTVPKVAGWGDDVRELSFVLFGVELSPGEPGEPGDPLGAALSAPGGRPMFD
jgi:SAM-dependent methyltransferase